MHKPGNPISKSKSFREYQYEESPSSSTVKKAAKLAQQKVENKIPVQINKKTWIYPKIIN